MPKRCQWLLPLLVALEVMGCRPVPSVDIPPADRQDDERLEQLGIKRVPVVTDPKTGFRVGGTNPTSLIRQLTEINGRRIADLEADMRPGQLSTAGFLGPEERLLDVMAEDNRYVVDQLGLTHQEVAFHLRAIVALSRKNGWDERNEWSEPILYQGKRFQVLLMSWKGYQESPFQDGLMTNSDAAIRNVDSGKELRFSVLVPLLIERYGFYEGKGTPYRVEPAAIVEVLDFLREKTKQ